MWTSPSVPVMTVLPLGIESPAFGAMAVPSGFWTLTDPSASSTEPKVAGSSACTAAVARAHPHRRATTAFCMARILRRRHAALLLDRLQRRGHLLVDQVDGLERPDHHLEVGDPAVLAPRNHVDAVDGQAVDLDRELEHRVTRTHDFADIA